jgi:hypothetical protein
MVGTNETGSRAYGSSHALAGRLAWAAAGLVAMGVGVLALTQPTDGTLLTGLGLAAVGLLLGIVVVVRLASPPVYAVTVAEDGLVFRDVSPRPIPWREIEAVEIRKVREVSAPTSRPVASIAVARSFFATLSTKTAWPGEVVSIGEPTWIHLAYYRHDVPVAELAALIEARVAAARRAG